MSSTNNGYTLVVVGVAACIAAYGLTSIHNDNHSSSNEFLTAKDVEYLRYVSKYGKSYSTKDEFT